MGQYYLLIAFDPDVRKPRSKAMVGATISAAEDDAAKDARISRRRVPKRDGGKT
jgi:hypothetical protein